MRNHAPSDAFCCSMGERFHVRRTCTMCMPVELVKWPTWSCPVFAMDEEVARIPCVLVSGPGLNIEEDIQQTLGPVGKWASEVRWLARCRINLSQVTHGNDGSVDCSERDADPCISAVAADFLLNFHLRRALRTRPSCLFVTNVLDDRQVCPVCH